MDRIKKYNQYAKGVGWFNRGGFAFRHFCARQLFRNINIKNKSMIDIGCGSGIYSIYGRMHGMSFVTGLEPYLSGSKKSRGKNIYENAIRYLELDNIEIINENIQNFNPGDRKWDIVLSCASLNHFDEYATVTLLENNDSYNKYIEIASKIRSLIKEDGYLIIVDAGRRNFFGDLGIKKKSLKSIDWEKHQQPEVWAKLFKKVGFKNPAINYRYNSVYGYLGRVQNNKLINYLRDSAFILQMRPGKQ